MKKISMLVLGLLIFSSFTLYSQPFQGRGEMGPKAPAAKKMLKLTPEQEKTFDNITYKHEQSLIDIHSKIQKNRLELKKIIDDGKIDEKTFLQLTDENTKLQGEIKTSSIKRWFEINKILTDDQKVAWEKMLSRITDPDVMKGKMQAGAHKMMMNKRGMGRMQGKGM
jgi:Spy/CpxP family protein refolding chaperone